VGATDHLHRGGARLRGLHLPAVRGRREAIGAAEVSRAAAPAAARASPG
jgi:hypothetical protein